MKIVEGGNDPLAHMHRREMPNCDICGAELRGRMPKPFWVASSSRRTDQFGRPLPEDTAVRVYLCKEHRELFEQTMLQRAWKREVNRRMKGQRMFGAALASSTPDLPQK
jgi:hypothetical protein